MATVTLVARWSSTATTLAFGGHYGANLIGTRPARTFASLTSFYATQIAPARVWYCSALKFCTWSVLVAVVCRSDV